MGKGQDKIALSLMDLQPTAIVEFFLLYFNTIDKEDSFIAFHGGSNFNKGIVWQGVTYLPVPVETEGFEVSANGQMPRPKIRISNKDYFMTDLLIRNSDFQYSKVIRKRTFIKYLDNVNFDGGNPWGEADSSAEISNESYIISQKIAENKNYVEFELTSPLDLDNFQLNNRLILSRYCPWTYRGNGCNYEGRAVETEEGQALYPNEITADGQYEWVLKKDYKINDPVYLLNKRIITDVIIDPNSSVPQNKYAKIWFVCQKNHTSSEQNKPDDGSQYWLKDGCTKKLSACKKRFSLTSKRLVRIPNKNITNNYIDFSFKNINPTNNIVYNSTGISAISTYTGVEYGPLNIKYTVDDASYSFWLGGDADASGVVYISGLPSSTINRINLFDAPSTANNFGTANFKISGTVNSTLSLTVNPDSATISSTIPSNPYSGVTGLSISASGGNGLRGLSQIDLIDNTFNYGLYNTEFISDKIHLNTGFLIGIWGQLASGAVTDIKLNILHTVKPNCRYSGLNLYLEGEYLYCDFATTSLSGNIVTITPQTIGPMSYQGISRGEKFCIFIENYQYSGNSTGQLNSKLIIYDINKSIIGEYYPAIANPSINYYGESFLFKDPSRQQGIDSLYFGVNQWENYSRGIVYTTPMKFSTVAIWSTSLINNDIRQDTFSSNKDANTNLLFPINYDQISQESSVLNDLYAWWDMDLQATKVIGINDNTWGSAPYRTLSNVIINIDNPISSNQTEYHAFNENPALNGSGFDGSPYLFLTGKYQASLETTQIQETLQYRVDDITPVLGLPFGGFPGTDKYGR